MHNGKTRKSSTKKTNVRDGTEEKFFDRFVALMKLEDDYHNKSYDNGKDEKVGRILLLMSLIMSIIFLVLPIIIAIM